MNEEQLEQLKNRIARAVESGSFQPKKYWHSDEIAAARARGDKRFPDHTFFWTGDLAVYTVEDGEPFLLLARRAHNIILNQPALAVVQLAKQQHVALDRAVLAGIEAAPDTIRVPMRELRLRHSTDCCWPHKPPERRRTYWAKPSTCDARYPHFHVELGAELTDAQRLVAERVFGRPLQPYLEFLSSKRVYQTKFSCWHPEHVRYTYDRIGPHANGCRASEINGPWEYDGNTLAICDGLLERV